MKGVVDSVSLIFILKMPELRVLAGGYLEKLYVTDQVYEEVFESKLSEEIIPFDDLKPFFERKSPSKILQANLGTGELSAISLSKESNLLFVSEDRKAVLFANSVGVKSASLLSILIKAREDGKISKNKARSVLFKIVENGFYMSSDLFSMIIKKLD
jgi:predicted nucleic acid-binding protein